MCTWACTHRIDLNCAMHISPSLEGWGNYA